MSEPFLVRVSYEASIMNGGDSSLSVRVVLAHGLRMTREAARREKSAAHRLGTGCVREIALAFSDGTCASVPYCAESFGALLDALVEKRIGRSEALAFFEADCGAPLP